MAEPRSWQLLQGALASLQQIKTSAGFYTNAGAEATLEPGQVTELQTDLALAVYQESVSRPASPAMARIAREVVVLIVVQVRSDLDELQQTLHRALADVDHAMTGNAARFPEGITRPQYAGTAPTAPPQGANWIGAEIRFLSTFTL